MPWSALGSMGASIINAGSQAATNEANKEIAQMNNDFNERMMQKQMDYNTQMWEKNNEYNSAKNQVARLQEAGLNPALMLGQVGAGNASSSQANSVNAASASGNPTMQAPQLVNIADAIRLGFEKKLNDAQVRKLNYESEAQAITNQSLAEMKTREIQEAIARTEDYESKAALNMKLHQWQDQINQSEINRNVAQTELYQNNVRESLLKQYEQEIRLDALPQMLRNEILKGSADIALTSAQKNLTEKQFEHEIEKMVETTAKANGFILDNKIKSETKDAIVERAKLDAIPDGFFGAARIGHWSGERAAETFDNISNQVKKGAKNIGKWIRNNESKHGWLD